MMLLWLDGSKTAHLATFRGGMGKWAARCYRVTASYENDPAAGFTSDSDWRGLRGGRPANLVHPDDVPHGMAVCQLCLRHLRAEAGATEALLRRLGQR